MADPWQHLLVNFAMVVMIVSLWNHAQRWTSPWSLRHRAILFGLLMGIGAAGLMLQPFELAPGVFVDLRSALIAIAGFVGGPIGAAIAGSIGVSMRIFLGGPGSLAGCTGIALAALTGLVGYVLLRGRKPTTRDAVLLSGAVSFVALANFLIVPRALQAELVSRVALPVVLVLFVTTAFSLISIINERRRRDANESNHLYKAVIEALPDCLNIKDKDGRFLVANPATARLMQADSAADLIDKTDFDFYPNETAELFRREELAILTSGEPQELEQKLAATDGKTIWLTTLKAPVKNQAGEIAGIITHNRNVTAKHQMQAELIESRDRLSAALAGMSDGLVMFDQDERLILCNDQYRAFFPKTADVRVPGAALRQILTTAVERGEPVELEAKDAQAWIDKGCASLHLANERELKLHNDRWVQLRISPLPNGSTMILFSDISRRKSDEEELLQLNTKLDLLARTDGLTQLTNRRGFDQALETEFARSARAKTPLSILFIDIDRFKTYNDNFGHVAGDKALAAIAAKLRQTLKRPGDIAARYGGEEMVAILPVTDQAGAVALAEQFRLGVRALRLKNPHSEMGIVTVSVGVATHIAGDGLKKPAGLIERADKALYASKSSGRDRVVADGSEVSLQIA